MAPTPPMLRLPMTPDRLLASLLANPWGQLSPSIYETGRLVTLAPWLAGHDGRVAFLLGQQRADGGWGGPGPYGLVPSLSATEALLTELRRQPRPPLVAAARAGLARVRAMLASTQWLPDTPAVEVLVPVLVEAVNRHLTEFEASTGGADGTGPESGAAELGSVTPLGLPPGVDAAHAAGIRGAIASGGPLPDKVLHALEIAGSGARSAAARPVPPGTVGASPAATAAWLRRERPDPAALAYLDGCMRPHGGPVPSVIPITMFERTWVLDSLLGCGVRVQVPPDLIASIVDGLGPLGTPGGAGLPRDADTTSTAILTAHRLGTKVSLDPLRHFETPTHFVTWDGERTSSATTNAHVLACLGAVDADTDLTTAAFPDDTRATRDWRNAAIAKVARWLGEQQRADGTWVDKWHASPYYATAAAAGALRRHGGGTAVPVVRRAVEWTMQTQHDDGSWGIWGGTSEETAYALHLLVPGLGPEPGADHIARAAARGLAHLQRARSAGQLGSAEVPDHTPLWHDKDLYTPTAVVEAAVIGALQIARSHPALSAMGTLST